MAAGHFGQEPSGPDQQHDFVVSTLGRLTDPAEFGNVILRSTTDGRVVRIRDVGRVALGPRNQDIQSMIDGHPCSTLAIYQLPYANAIDTAGRVRARMAELRHDFPEDLDYVIQYDTTPFVQESINEVFRTLVEATILVAIVVLVFLQNWRSALIPLTAVPVAIIGTFAVMAAIGFSLNNLTLFGLVLAIGIVVDDAIVVVEAIEHHIREGMTPHAAAHQAMREVSGPVVAVALVLSAVFIPCAFMTGITGQFFRQFALTIAVSTLISAFNSLTLSPALAALLLQPKNARKDRFGRLLDLGFGWFFRGFNWTFGTTRDLYSRSVRLALRGSAIVLFVYAGLIGLTWFTANSLPVGYIPAQDQGKLYVAVQLPDSASIERTQKVMDQIGRIIDETPGVAHTMAVSGQSFSLGAYGSNFGNFVITLKDFDERRDRSLSADAILARMQRRLDQEIPDAIAKAFTPAPVYGLGSTGGFKVVLEDRGDKGLDELQREAQRLIAASRPDPRDPKTLPREAPQSKISRLLTVFRADTPELYVDLNRDQCSKLGVKVSDVFNTLQIYLGSLYVNDFNRFGRTWQVVAQAEGKFRNDPSRVKLLKVRNAQGQMVPLGAILDVRLVTGPFLIQRYNMYPAAVIVGDTRPDVSSGEGIDIIDRLCEQTLGQSMGHEWTEINFIQIDAAKNVGNRLIFPLSVVFVFLVLAAQYESWALPLAVILVVPMCILGSLTGVLVTHTNINIFTQIGFVVLVGLASKNAILIVEFAKHKREAGHTREAATLEACRLRLKPILMTSFAFILGVVPLLLGTGAGAEMRRTLGIAVFSGMLGVTIFGIFLTPVFFYVIEGMAESSTLHSPAARRIGYVLKIALRVGTLGIFWFSEVLGKKLSQRLGRRSRGYPLPGTNGIANGRNKEALLHNGEPTRSGNGAHRAPVEEGIPAAKD